MVRGGEKKKKSDKHILVLKTDLSRDKGFLYYIDKNGDVCSTKMSRGGTARKKKNARKTAARKKAAAKRTTKKKATKKKATKKKATKKKATKKKATKKKQLRKKLLNN